MSYTLTELDLTIGALQIGSVVSVFLFGIITLQAYLYYASFRDDRWSFKALVAVVWILEFTYTGTIIYQVYILTITLHSEPQLITLFPAIGITTATGGLITFFTQGFFALRLYVILPKPYAYIGVFCIFLSVIRCVGSLFLSVQAVIDKSIEVYQTQWSWLITTLLAGGAAVDLIIATSMLYYLSRKRAKALEKTTRLIHYLIAYTIRTGLLTSVSAAIVLICFQTMPSNFIWLAVYVSLVKLYSNSLYSTLNARREMRINIQDSLESSRSRRGNAQSISIGMKTTMETTEDWHKSSPSHTNDYLSF